MKEKYTKPDFRLLDFEVNEAIAACNMSEPDKLPMSIVTNFTKACESKDVEIERYCYFTSSDTTFQS